MLRPSSALSWVGGPGAVSAWRSFVSTTLLWHGTFVVNSLLNHIHDALADIGDLHRVEELVDRTLARGTGAARQLEVLHRTGDLEEVVADAAVCTVSGAG